MATWHPDAQRVPYPDAGAFTVGKPKLVWHTTEGSSLPRYSGSAPHFTFDPKANKLWQHVPINRASSSLVHPPNVETNHAHAIQVELIGFAKDTPGWSTQTYLNIAKLARWIESNAGVARACHVNFVKYPSSSYPRLPAQAWLDYAGHCGHQHVPGNEHGDPGGFHIELVIAGGGAHSASDYPGHVLRQGANESAVLTLQRWLNTVRNPQTQAQLFVDGVFGQATDKRVRQFQTHHRLDVDGSVGKTTWAALRTAARNHK
jgi:hypothetical protein